MANTIKKDGTYDGRTKAGRQSKGKSLAPKTTTKKMTKALKNTKKAGK